MTDDLDHYTNTYQVYSKDPKRCQEFLGSPGVINWKQHLQIQSKGPGRGLAARLSMSELQGPFTSGITPLYSL